MGVDYDPMHGAGIAEAGLAASQEEHAGAARGYR
jgi:hypothetical protein